MMPNVDEIVDFMVLSGNGVYGFHQYNELRQAIEGHLSYKTIIIVRDDEGISAICRWDITHDGLAAYIIDLIVRKDKKSMSLIKNILSYGVKTFPETEVVYWKREPKYPNKKQRFYIIDDILKRRS